MARVRLWVVLFISVLAVGCAKQEENNQLATESEGLIAKVNGVVVALKAEEEAEVCSNTFCEPNYIYHASFGGGNPDPPPPTAAATTSTPPPRPTPPPTQPPTDPIVERLGYGQQIMNLGGERAWNFSIGSDEVIVAVVDTGVQVDHRDLADNIHRNMAEYNGRSGIDDDGNGYVDDIYGWDFVNNRPNGLDDNRHGTHCAGIIGAAANGIGVVGINQKVKIMPLKFLDAGGSGSTDNAIAAIHYAIDNGAHVISNSWGGGSRSELLDRAIQRAINAGIVVVAAAGNEQSNNDASPSYPANYQNVIAVASTDERDDLSSFSNYGRNTVEIAAPGSRIISTVLNHNWASLSGTSMAAPQVAGAIALAISVNDSLSVNDIKQLMCDSARRIHLNRVVCGRLDVEAFVNATRNF